MIGIGKTKFSEKGMTLLEALVSTAIIGIGFVAVFQMVNYSVQSIDVSGERTKANYLVSMVAEDLISERDSNSPTTDVKFKDYLINNSWSMANCSNRGTSSTNFNNAVQNKFQKWDKRFSKERLKCKGNKDNKILKIYEICNNNAATNNCKYNNTTNYKGNGVYEKWYLGKMEVNLNDGKKKKYLYFQFN